MSPERAGQKTDANMVSSAYDLACRDLAALSPPPNLPEPLFNLHVANALRQLTVIREVMDATAKGIPDRHALKIIVPYHDPEQDVSINDAWRILKDWIMHFFPGEFRIEADQEVLVRGRQY